jgi:3-keto-disaccharide hydrolase
MLFWLTGKDNFYEVVAAPNGLFTVARKVRGKLAPTAPVPWTKTSALKLGADAKNTLRVTLDGQMVTLRINDTEVAHFRGQPPEGPSHVGLVAASAPGTSDTWKLSDLKVTNVASAEGEAKAAGDKDISTGTVAAAPGCADGKVLFEDRFTSHDPTWGPKDARLKIDSGEAVLSPVPGTRTFRWNRAFVFDDVDACATMRLTKPTSDSTASYAGLMFWVEDNRNYYQAVLAPNGYFTVARVVDGVVQAKRPVEWVKTDAAKTGAKEKNTLRIMAKGDHVAISVNGTEVADFTGVPPKDPSYIGLLAASAPSKRGDDWTITDFKVTQPR